MSNNIGDTHYHDFQPFQPSDVIRVHSSVLFVWVRVRVTVRVTVTVTAPVTAPVTVTVRVKVKAIHIIVFSNHFTPVTSVGDTHRYFSHGLGLGLGLVPSMMINTIVQDTQQHGQRRISPNRVWAFIAEVVLVGRNERRHDG